MSAEQFVACVHNEDATSLVKLPGVGKKTAERLVLEMKDRLKDWGMDLFTPYTDGAILEMQEDPTVKGNAQDDAIAALMALGYKANQAEKAVKGLKGFGNSSEVLIKEALKAMM